MCARGHPQSPPCYVLGWALPIHDFLDLVVDPGPPDHLSSMRGLVSGMPMFIYKVWADKYRATIPCVLLGFEGVFPILTFNRDRYAARKIQLRRRGRPDCILISLATNNVENYSELNNKELIRNIILANMDVLGLPGIMGNTAKWHRVSKC